ncbi:EpsG family protein [Acinetobacter sp. YH12066]|uniref:EpsG family protein n=1 Tax=Acinetobacter sp. YH12066 TaxID=2601063 RepID=UPI0015D32AFB|nr:EpsG family protein [Acinetobacter sp. YH12066]
MIPYILVVFFVLFFVLYEQKILGRKAVLVPLFLLVALASIRSNRVGTDSGTYTAAYTEEYYPYEFGFDSNIEYGYQLLDSIIIRFSYDYFWLFLVTSIIVVMSHLITIKKISVNYFWSIFIYMTFGYYTFFFNGLRQGLAMAICLLGLPYLIQEKFLPYLIVITFASTFHISALIMLAFYFLVHIKLKLEFKVVFCAIISVLSSQILIQYFAKNNARYEHYTQQAEQPGGYITLAFYFIVAFFIYIYGLKVRKDDMAFNKLEQIFLCGLALVFPIALLGTDPSGPQRIMYYFVDTVIFLIPYVLKRFNSFYFNLFFFVISIIYFILITMRFSNLYPYQINSIFGIF